MPDNTNQPNVPNAPNIKELVDRANEIYLTLKPQLEPTNNGKYVVIEVNSGRHFVGDTKDEAMVVARREFPGIILFVRRIGGLEKVSRHSSSFSPKKYARLF